MLERARRASRTDSDLFADATALIDTYIRTRQELCKRGELFMSSALDYSERHATASLEALKKEKQADEASGAVLMQAEEPEAMVRFFPLDILSTHLLSLPTFKASRTAR